MTDKQFDFLTEIDAAAEAALPMPFCNDLLPETLEEYARRPALTLDRGVRALQYLLDFVEAQSERRKHGECHGTRFCSASTICSSTMPANRSPARRSSGFHRHAEARHRAELDKPRCGA